MTPSFFEWALKFSGQTIRLSDLSDDTRQHIKAQRLSPGDALILLDGLGVAHGCRLGPEKSITLLSSTQQPALHPKVHLILSPPKGDALSDAISQATEIGVSELTLIRSDHCQWSEKMNLPLERLQRISDQACSQSCRAYRMTIHPKIASPQALASAPHQTHVVADEAASGPSRSLKLASTMHLWIGPEGGWSDRERQFFGDFATRLSLGSLILRVPTAIVAAMQRLKDLPADC